MLIAENGASLCSELLTIVESSWDAVQGADALALVTEWKEFRSTDFDRLSQALSGKVIFDGRNLYDPETVEAAGLIYHAIGRIGKGVSL